MMSVKMYFNQRLEMRLRPFWVVLIAFCALLLVLPPAMSADDGLNFEADPLLQDLLSKRAQRNQQQQTEEPSPNNKASAAKAKPAADKASKSSRPAPSASAKQSTSANKKGESSLGLGQSLIKLESKSQRSNDAVTETPSQAPSQPEPATPNSDVASQTEKANRDSLYSADQLKQFEQASDWIKPRSEAVKERRPREIPGLDEPAKQAKTAATKKKTADANAASISLDAAAPKPKTSANPPTAAAPSKASGSELDASRLPATSNSDDSGLPPALEAAPQTSADKLDKADALEVEKDILAADKKLDSVSGASVKEYVVPENEPVAVAWHRERAEEGDVDAQYNLAVIYATGFGVKQDLRSAAWWYEQAANHKNAQAQLRLGMLYIIGLGVDGSVIKGTNLIQEAANQGVSLARVINDKLLAKPIDGLDIPKAMSKIRQVYLTKNEKAASDALLNIVARAEIDAETNRKAERFNGQVTGSAAKLGSVGNHIPSFLAPAKPQTEVIIGDPVARIRRHAKEGNVDAQFEYARMLDHGKDVARDRQQALAWYSKAASKNHSGALFYLAVAHLYGDGIPLDVPKGREMLKQAADLKQPVAQKLLAYLSDGKKEVIDDNSSVALAWNLDLAMTDNDPDAMSALGHIFNNGWGVKQNSEEGQTWLRKSRAAGGKGADRELRRMKIDKMMSASGKEQSETSLAATAEAANDPEAVAQASDATTPSAVADMNASSNAVVAAVPAAKDATSKVTASRDTPSKDTPSKDAASLLLAAADATGANKDASNLSNNAERKNITRGTLPSNSPVAKKAQLLQQEQNAGQALIARPKPQVDNVGFWDNVVQRSRNLFRHDDDPFKPVFLVIMGVLLGLAVFKGMRNRDMRKYHQTQEQTPFS